MKATIEFSLPDERSDYKAATLFPDMSQALGPRKIYPTPEEIELIARNRGLVA